MSAKEKCMIVSIVLLILIILAIIIPFAVLLARKSPKDTKVCMSSECIKSAGKFMESMNLEADPCENFYEYACGNWKGGMDVKRNYQANEAQLLQEAIYDQVKNLLEKPFDAVKEIKSVGKAKLFYKSCMNTTQIKTDGIKEFKEILVKCKGSPIWSTKWTKEEENNWKLENSLKNSLELYGTNFLISFLILADQTDSSKYIMNLFPDPLLLYPKNTTKSKEKYLTFMKDMVILFGADEAQLSNTLTDVLDFETSISKNLDMEFSIQPIENNTKISIQKLKDQIPSFDWLDIFQSMSPTMAPDTEITTNFLEPLKKVFTIIEKTPKKTLANFVSWTLIKMFLEVFTFPENVIQAYRKFSTTKIEDINMSFRWDHCVQKTYNIFHFTLTKMFADEHLDKKETKYVSEMMKDLKMEFSEIIKNSDWLDDETKNSALKKVKNMRDVVGYSKVIDNKTFLDDYNDGLEIKENAYTLNIFASSRLSIKRNWKKLFKQTTPKLQGSLEVNAEYSPSENRIVIYPSMLQPFLISLDYPTAVNYGSLGSTIGHEVTHGFDNLGKEYDENGKKLNWWSNDTKKAYSKKVACMIKQYNDFPLKYKDLKVNGSFTLNENIADNGGIKTALNAYRHFVEKNGPDQTFPGINLTSLQLMFLSYTKMYCSSLNKKELKYTLLDDIHSPGPARVNVPLQNTAEFSKAFKCAIGSGMNPEKKCAVW